MRLIEPHIHTVSRTTDDLYRMAAAGIVACVEPSFWSGVYRRSPESFQDYWEQVVTIEPKRAARYGIKHFAMVGLNPREAGSPIALDVLKAMEPFLDRPSVIGIGEVGLDLATNEEEDAFRRQLRMAEERRLPVVVRCPGQNRENCLERVISIIEDEQVTQERIVIDHAAGQAAALILDRTGCWAGLTVHDSARLSAEKAVDIVERCGMERLMVNGSADWSTSDPLAVPKVALLMRRRGFSMEAVRGLTFANPYRFLASSGRFDIEED
jgi:predicted metal-dependent TIM-barrel fold hydrolase